MTQFIERSHGLPFMNKISFWILVLGCTSTATWLVSDILTPFVLAFIFAYLLQSVVSIIVQKFHLPRWLAMAGVFSGFVSVFVVGLIVLIPAIYQQIFIFIKKIPVYKSHIDGALNGLLIQVDGIDHSIASAMKDSLQNLVGGSLSLIMNIANNAWDYTLATINFFALVALVPVILYYFLRDWSQMIESAESILPMQQKSKIKHIFADINQLLSAYVIGQLSICLILSLYYIAGLYCIGIDLALLLGIMAGFLVIIPFIGPVVSLCLMLLSCYFSYGASQELVYVLALFTIGHIMESYVLTPKIIGDRIGLHPVWIIFAVFAAGSVFGFVGILFAIPVAGIIRLLLSHILDYYRSSNMYNNQDIK